MLSCGAHEYSDSVNSFSAWRTDQHAVHEPAAAALLAPEVSHVMAPSCDIYTTHEILVRLLMHRRARCARASWLLRCWPPMCRTSVVACQSGLISEQGVYVETCLIFLCSPAAFFHITVWCVSAQTRAPLAPAGPHVRTAFSCEIYFGVFVGFPSGEIAHTSTSCTSCTNFRAAASRVAAPQSLFVMLKGRYSFVAPRKLVDLRWC